MAPRKPKVLTAAEKQGQLTDALSTPEKAKPAEPQRRNGNR